MTIKTKLFISSLSEILLVFFVAIFLVISSGRITRAADNADKATGVVKTITEIRFVTFENLLNHDERSFQQWQLKHSDLLSRVASHAPETESEKESLYKITALSQEVKVLFERLIASYEDTSASLGDQKAFQNRLTTQVMSKQQSQITEAFKLADSANQQAKELRRQTYGLVVAATLLMLAIMGANYLFVAGSITKALSLLQKGADRIAAGKFGYRIKYSNTKNELGHLALSFNTMAASLEQLDKAKTEFILLASHQLRTPLTAIKWSTEEVLSDAAHMNPRKKKRYLRQIHDSNERMIALVNNLLITSKIDLNKLSVNPAPIRLSSALNQVLQDLAPQIKSKNLIVDKTLSKPGTLVIDPIWLNIIFQNLLSNAIKYSAPKQRIVVAIEGSPGYVTISVSDEGYGIPLDQQSKIFTKLFRGDNARRLVSDGSGLGLYITKAVVEQSGGAIWFKSAENHGTTFYVKLPGRESNFKSRRKK